jgi:1-phosphofructokinase
MIITLTLNPAIDETVEIDHLVVADTNRIAAIRRDIGGKGVNVARVLRELGYEPLAMGFAPGRFGGMIEEQLTDEGIGCDFIPYPGETRTNINILDRAVHETTVFAAPGPTVPPEAIDRLSRHLRRRMRRDTWLVLAGSMPPGMEVTFHAEALSLARALGATTVMDADGPVVEQVFALDARPDILKMNDHELGRLLHRACDDEESTLEGARSLRRLGIESAVITRGGEGAVAVTPEGEFRAIPPLVTVDSAVGAGDGFLAGLLLGLRQERGWGESLRLASAVGAAVCMSPGTALCHRGDVNELLPNGVVERIRERVGAR